MRGSTPVISGFFPDPTTGRVIGMSSGDGSTVLERFEYRATDPVAPR
ncbi:hypothetical protein [Arthrobacter burdickii]|uniref:Uncharacterized protein n=1 Tax=Arthrobacter burdickii TaxID=3035920 RepID=A0ABT8JXF4_9MICC|nr:hypothetical protein [Arthrobacter burdickii]MDN4609843.1 hypothetical protein [Arthrobacter burdickii]